MIKAIVSLHILLIALPVCAGTFVDDFEDGNIAGWSAVGEWSVESGELVGENMEPAYDSGAIFFGELTWSNYTIEADVKLIRSSGDPCINPSSLINTLSSASIPYPSAVWNTVVAELAYWTEERPLMTKLVPFHLMPILKAIFWDVSVPPKKSALNSK